MNFFRRTEVGLLAAIAVVVVLTALLDTQHNYLRDPKTSAVNRYMQSWDVSNLFIFGASACPQNAGYNPTGTVGALAFWGGRGDSHPVSEKPWPAGANVKGRAMRRAVLT